MELKWSEIGDTILINKKLFYHLLKWIKKDKFIKIEILNYTGEKPKI